MAQLSHRDYDALLSGLRELYACRSMDDYPKTALAVCSRLIRGNISAYSEIDTRHDRWKGVYDSPESEQAIQAIEDAWQRHFHTHPVLRYHEGNDAPEVRSISDFLSPDRWTNEPLYNEFFRLLGALDQLVIPAPRRDGLIIGIAVNRDRRGFSRRDRLLGSLLREHLFQVHANVAALEELRTRLSELEEWYARGGMAVLVISDTGHILQCSLAAAALFQRHFDWRSGSSKILPMSLWRWARRQISAIRRRDQTLAPLEPLVVRSDTATFVVRLLPDRDPSRFILLAREESNLVRADVLCRLGLTLREAEVLYWVAHGKANAEVAARLAISPRTVQKHLERIFDKLGVTTRTEAAILAIEHLRST